MTKEELDEQLATVTTARQRLAEALRDWVPPDYFTQREITAEKEDMRRRIEAYEAYERKLLGRCFALSLRAAVK